MKQSPGQLIKYLAVTVLPIILTVGQVHAESMSVEKNLPVKEIQIQKKLHYRNHISTLDVIRIDVVPVAPTRSLTYAKNRDNTCLAEGDSGGCGQFLLSSADVENYATDYGMFSVIGTGIRLPDDQVESADGLEDDWGLD